MEAATAQHATAEPANFSVGAVRSSYMPQPMSTRSLSLVPCAGWGGEEEEDEGRQAGRRVGRQSSCPSIHGSALLVAGPWTTHTLGGEGESAAQSAVEGVTDRHINPRGFMLLLLDALVHPYKLPEAWLSQSHHPSSPPPPKSPLPPSLPP